MTEFVVDDERYVVKVPRELRDVASIMRNMVLDNHVICGTVNAGRASFEEAVDDLGWFMQTFPDAVSALITSRTPLEGAREAVLAPGGIKNVITIG